MEPAEREHIKSNKADLASNTQCNCVVLTKLQARKHLSELDVEDIRKEGEGIRAGMKLYTTLLTRQGAYSTLIQVLREETQTGAVAILERLYTNAATAGHPSGQPLVNRRRDVVLGSTGCSIPEVVGIWKECDVFSQFVAGNWKTLAYKLGVSYTDVKQMSNDMFVNKLDVTDATIKVLIKWQGKSKQVATLGMLIDVLEELDLNHFAGLIKARYSIQ